jgi:predicted MFS family arabinose efflux permease
MSDHPQDQHDKSTHWLDKPGNVKTLLRVLVGFGALLFIADAFYHKHAHFPVEEFFGFYALFGFAAFAGIVLAGKYLRKILMRPEDYYDRDYDND